MHLHVIQHVPFEGPEAIADWAAERGHTLSSGLALAEDFPSAHEVDFLVVMGGPMAADSEAANPWLVGEKRFIAETITAGRLVLGVCLGAQILAEVIGGTVRRSENKEIGWYAVEPIAERPLEPLFTSWDRPVVVGQWHGDTFDLSLGMEPVLTSEACRNQAFVFDGRVVGLQFHLEWTQEALDRLIDACSDEIAAGGRYVMSAQEIRDEAPERLDECRSRLFALLDGMVDEGTGLAGTGAL